MSMKRLSILCSIIFCCSLFGGSKLKGQGYYHISGHLTGLPEGQNIFLVRNKEKARGTDTIARAVSFVNGFILKGELLAEGEVCFIKIHNLDLLRNHPERRDKYIKIAIESSNLIKVIGDINNLSDSAINVTGSNTHIDYLDFMNKGQSLMQQQEKSEASIRNRFLEKKTDSLTYVKQIQDVRIKTQREYDQLVKSWVLNHANSRFTPWVLMTNYDNVELLEQSIRHLTPRALESYYGQKLKSKIAKMKAINVGSIASDFTLSDVNGNVVSLHRIAATAKYTIVDFWASWCKPCRLSFPKMKDLYSTYKEKGLAIIGFSIDKKEENWKKALLEDKLSWTNVRQTNGNFARDKYMVEMIPSCFIIDQKGIIVASALHSGELEHKIKELFGE